MCGLYQPFGDVEIDPLVFRPSPFVRIFLPSLLLPFTIITAQLRTTIRLELPHLFSRLVSTVSLSYSRFFSYMLSTHKYWRTHPDFILKYQTDGCWNKHPKNYTLHLCTTSSFSSRQHINWRFPHISDSQMGTWHHLRSLRLTIHPVAFPADHFRP